MESLATLFVGIDESNHGLPHEIYVATFSRDSAEAEKTKNRPKIRKNNL